MGLYGIGHKLWSFCGFWRAALWLRRDGEGAQEEVVEEDIIEEVVQEVIALDAKPKSDVGEMELVEVE